mmetsp:Transcript_41886/g.107940  ORF Transcript_41886/g.107940 Transcript_41886/m.107940 type:complete len:323 (+) Transcript_41886:434-1402(+)
MITGVPSRSEAMFPDQRSPCKSEGLMLSGGPSGSKNSGTFSRSFAPTSCISLSQAWFARNIFNWSPSRHSFQKSTQFMSFPSALFFCGQAPQQPSRGKPNCCQSAGGAAACSAARPSPKRLVFVPPPRSNASCTMKALPGRSSPTNQGSGTFNAPPAAFPKRRNASASYSRISLLALLPPVPHLTKARPLSVSSMKLPPPSVDFSTLLQTPFSSSCRLTSSPAVNAATRTINRLSARCRRRNVSQNPPTPRAWASRCGATAALAKAGASEPCLCRTSGDLAAKSSAEATMQHRHRHKDSLVTIARKSGPIGAPARSLREMQA